MNPLVPHLVRELGQGYAVTGTGGVRHVASGVCFRYVPAAIFVMGMAPAAWKRVRRMMSPETRQGARATTMQPVREVTVDAFLLAEEPLCRDELVDLLGATPSLVRARGGALDLDSLLETGALAALGPALEHRGWRLPSEAEWEHACRAGSDALFPSGVDMLPASPRLGPNAFGLRMLGELPEVCADGWHGTYEGAPADARPWIGEGGVARGGSAWSWPWQACDEWILSLCAMRTPLGGLPFAVRPALSLSDEIVASAMDAARAERFSRPPAPPPFRRASTQAQEIVDRYGVPHFDLRELGRIDAEAAAAQIDELHRRYVVRRMELDATDAAGTSLVLRILPLLVERGTPARGGLLRLLADILWENHVRVLPRGRHSLSRDHLAHLVKHARGMADLLGDEDARVRGTAPLLLALAGPPATGIFMKRLDVETDPTVRASAAVGLGIVAPEGPSSAAIQERLLREARTAEDGPMRGAAALALGTMMGPDTPADVRTMVAALVRAQRLPAEKYPWHHGDVAAHAKLVAATWD